MTSSINESSHKVKYGVKQTEEKQIQKDQIKEDD